MWKNMFTECLNYLVSFSINYLAVKCLFGTHFTVHNSQSIPLKSILCIKEKLDFKFNFSNVHKYIRGKKTEIVALQTFLTSTYFLSLIRKVTHTAWESASVTSLKSSLHTKCLYGAIWARLRVASLYSRTTVLNIFIVRDHLVLLKVKVLLEPLTNSHKVFMT